MKHIRFIFALFLLCAPGCQRLTEKDSTNGEFLIHARIADGDDTKTSLSALGPDGKYHPLWTAGDKITVFADGSTASSDFSLTSGAGTDQGSFTGATTGSSLVGFYPSSAIEGFSGNTLTIQLPVEQAYVVGTFAQGVFPMIAVGSPGNLPFKNLCAILKISMTGEEQVNSIVFKPADASKVVSGKATVQTNYGNGSPQLVMAAGGSNTVTLNCGAVQLNSTTPTDFFLVIPPGTYMGGFSLDIKTFHGTITKSTTQDISFERSQFRSIPAFECAGSGEDDPNNVPYNQVWYVTTDGNIAKPSIYNDGQPFNCAIVSNTYAGGKGIMVLDGKLTRVNDYAFSGSDNLKEIYLPNTVEEIGFNAFCCENLSLFRVPENFRDSGGSIFIGNAIESFTGPHTSADGKAIVLDNRLIAVAGKNRTSFTIPSDVTVIDNGAFCSCYALETVDIPEGVTQINREAFAFCNELRSVSFPNSLETLDSWYPFLYCYNIEGFYGNPSFITPDNKGAVAHSANSSYRILVSVVRKGLTEYVIPEGITHVGNYAFDQAKELRKVTFPSTMSYVGPETFVGCDNLEEIEGYHVSADHKCYIVDGELLFFVNKGVKEYTVPEEVQYVAWNGFRAKQDLETIVLHDGVKEIADYVFNDCPKLKSITLSSNLTNIGHDPFIGSDNLESVYLRALVPPVLSVYIYQTDFDKLKIYVPESAYDSYVNSSYWAPYKKYLTPYQFGDIGTPDYYISSDYSRDGEVTTLQTASEGNGIDLVLMGDAFSDRQVADGTYTAVMQKMANAFLSEEPYNTYRTMFNVYSVAVISQTEGYEHDGQALESWHGEGTSVGGNDDKCMTYAQKAISASRLDKALIVVAMNSDTYAGTCYMYYSSNMQGDWGNGMSVSYFPTGESDEALAQVVHHEAGGHGFAKLADEYAYESMGAIPQSEIDNTNQLVPAGWWKNGDFTNDPATVKWSHFLSDERYQYDGLGCFEGAFTYWTGAWRPSFNSIMRYNTGGFNAPSREAIWYRLHKLAYGDEWVYNYEDFVAYDAVNRKTSASAPRRNYVERALPPLHPPVVMGRRWDAPAEQ